MSEGRNIFVCGRTGTGKSYLVKRLIADAARLILYLPKREELDYPGVTFDLLEHPGEHGRFVAFWAYCYGRGRYRLIYRPADIFAIDPFEWLCEGVYFCGNMTFVCEDLMTYVTPQVPLGSGFKTLLSAGRTRGIDCYLVTQRPYKIPREVTSQAREAYIFASHEPADVDYVKDAFGTDAAIMMAALNQYEYVHWIDTGQVEVDKA